MRARMWAVVVSVAAVAGTGCGVVPIFAGMERAEGTFERTLPVTAPVNLDVSTGAGSIVVRAGADRTVRVEGRVVVRENELFGQSHLSPEERVRRLVEQPPVEQTGDQIRIGRIDDEDLRSSVSISYIVTVPADTSLVSRSGSGSHEISAISGPIVVSAGSGSIRVRDAGSSVRASAGSGSIAVERVAGSLEARAGSGSIDGTDVGGAIAVKAGSGSIRVSQAGAGDVEASAGSGSIELAGIRGAVRASTGSGSLTVRGEPTSTWRLSASSGNVTVELEGARAFELDASGGQIETAYPVTMTGQVSRRALHGLVNGGGPLLQVRTSSGRVRIR